MRTYDIVILGSGPSALGALHGINPKKSTAIITGEIEASSQLFSRALHPKIRFAMKSSNSNQAVCAPYYFKNLKSCLISASVQGGLSHFWGRQLNVYREEEPWQQSQCRSWEEYANECKKITQAFGMKPSFQKGSSTKSYDGNIFFKRPSLIDQPDFNFDTVNNPVCNLLRKKVEAFSFDLINNRAKSFWKSSDSIIVELQDGNLIKTARCIIACGAIGTLNLLKRSVPEITEFTLDDHSPHLLYLLPNKSFRETLNSNETQSWNTLTIELMRQNSLRAYGSAYNLGKTPFGLLLEHFGLPNVNIFSSGISPLSKLTPIQIWDEASFSKYRFFPRKKIASAEHLFSFSERKSAELFVKDRLRLLGMPILTSKTRPGFGFHYHNLKLKLEGQKNFTDVEKFVHSRYANSVLVVDGSAIRKIGLQPHSLTMMVMAKMKSEQV